MKSILNTMKMNQYSKHYEKYLKHYKMNQYPKHFEKYLKHYKNESVF